MSFGDNGKDTLFNVENGNGSVVSGKTDIRVIGHENTCGGFRNLFRWIKIFPDSYLVEADNLRFVNEDKLMDLELSSSFC